MLKTTTPTFEIKTVGVDLSLIQTIIITIKQHDYTVIKSNDDIEVDNGVISVSLTQAEYSKLKSGDISISVGATAYDGNVYIVKTEWGKFGSRTSYEGGSGGGGTEYDILPTVESVEANTESGKLVDALAIKEVFQSVSDGKSMIASAITDKGVQTDATATFQEMAEHIGQIEAGGGNGDCPISSPYLFDLNSKIPFSTGSGDIRIPFFINKLKRLVVKKVYIYAYKSSNMNSSGTISFYIKGKKYGSDSEYSVKQWWGSVSQSATSKQIENISTDLEIDLTEWNEITGIHIQKGSSNGTVVSVDVTIRFQAELYF